MEHEIENLIRQKVREADAMPVAWKKDLAWQQVALPVPRKPKRIFYYAAAALIAGLSAFYILQVRQQSITDTRIHDLELSIKNKTDEQGKHLGNPVIPQLNACAPINDLPPSISKRNRLAATSRLQEKPLHGAVGISAKVETIPSEFTLPVEDKVMRDAVAVFDEAPVVAPVKAIIGYIPPQKELTIASRKVKKSKIRFLKSPEAEPNTPYAENKWITARIN